MIEILLAVGIAWWWIYHRKKSKSKDESEADKNYEGKVDIDGIPYGYVKDGENVSELV